jgi:PQQ-dependent catabolism-associated CXXCW motif protein
VLHGEVPATLSGAQVIRTEALAELLRGGGIISIDAASVPLRPYNLPNDAIWKPVPHENIAGTIWIPGIGEGNIQRDMEAFFRERLKTLTGSDLGRPIVFYCHPMCWASWNAAKRAMSFGYRKVIWYPDGAEGWQAAGHPLVIAHEERPSTRGIKPSTTAPAAH